MKNFEDVLDDYWDAAYREGEERRILDDGTAQEALSWLQAYSREAEANKARVAELEAAINGAIEATTSAIESQRKGDVDGWELHLILGRLNGAPYNAVHSKRNLL